MTSLRTAVRRSLSLSKFLMDFGSSECRPYTQVVAAVSYVISPTAHHPSARPSTALEVLTQAANARQEPFVCQRSDSVSQESSSGGWVIKRRPNGYTECLRSTSFKSPIATTYGSLFRSSDYAASRNYPVAFRDVPLVSIGVYSDTTIMSAADGGTQTKSPNVYAVYTSKRTTECDIVVTIKAEGYAD